MRVHWEKLGILGPVYGLVGRGFSNHEISSKLNVPEDSVRRCVEWLMRFGGYSCRAELTLEAFAAIPRDGEHQHVPPMRKLDFQSADSRQQKRQPASAFIQPGTMLMRDGLLLPDSLQIGTLRYSASWRVLTDMDSSSLGLKLSHAGLNLVFIAGELKVVQWGIGAEATRRGIKRILALSCKESFNCTEITQIIPAHFLRVPYVTVLAQSFHIQKGTILQCLTERRLEQTQRDWASG